MAIVDWLFIVVLLGSLALGAFRGFLHQVFSLANYLAALGIAQWYTPTVARSLMMTGADESTRYSTGFVTLFVASVAVGALLSKLHQRFFQMARPKSSDRFFGSLVGLVTGLGALLITTTIIGISPLSTRDSWRASTGVGISVAALHYVKPLFSEEVSVHLLSEK